MDKMEKCRPDDSIIGRVGVGCKRVLQECRRKGKEGSRGPAKRCCRCVSLPFITVSDLDATPKESMPIKTTEDTELGEITNTMKSRLKS